MSLVIDASTVLGVLAVMLSIASFVMKRMLPLRLLAIAANVAFIAFAVSVLMAARGDPQVSIPGLMMNMLLLPVNLRRAWEIRKLTRDITRAKRDSPVSEWLLPHMRRRTFKAGDVLFRKGETADKLIYLASGKLMLEEIGQALEAGVLLGEIGLFSPEKVRTQTLVAESGGEVYEMTDEALFQLYYQNPKLGFYIMRLITERLLRDIQRQHAHAVAV
jgi:CRP/FNR family cyclic AMP-dependent transcriptional regulator